MGRIRHDELGRERKKREGGINPMPDEESASPRAGNLKTVLRSRSRKEPHLLAGAGSGAVMQCGSGSDGSGSDDGIKHG
jgi:hypothetical protein